MDYLHLSVLILSIGAFSIFLINIYLYTMYRKRYMGIWAVSWLILLSRFVVFDSGLLPWKQSTFGLVIYQLLIMISGLMYVWGTHILVNKPLNKGWLYGTICTFILSVALNMLYSSLVYKLLLPTYIGCFILMWIGLTFIRHFKPQGIGCQITGYAFILWSILTLTMPFTISDSWFAPWGYAMSGILCLIIAIGTLMIYFDMSRTDLIHKESQYRLLAENAIDVIYHHQLLPKPKIGYISPSVQAFTGYTPEELYADNKLVLDLIHPDDHALLANFISNLPRSAELPLTLRLVRNDKTVLWIEQNCVVLYDEKGHFIALDGIIRDLTMRHELAQMTSMYDKMNMVGSMAAAVAHEIRNPMTTIRGYLQMLEKKEKYLADKEKFTLMIEELDRANTIIGEYLSLSHKKAIDFKICSLNNIIETLFPLIQANVHASKISANLDLTDIPELLLDENEIRQLLLNLIRNSIEAMPAGGDLVIHTSKEETKVVLSIKDQGSGIPSHILDNLGTPFITSKDTGTGLGLPICYQIAHRHNAIIKINTSDEGTTFFINFSLPAL